MIWITGLLMDAKTPQAHGDLAITIWGFSGSEKVVICYDFHLVGFAE